MWNWLYLYISISIYISLSLSVSIFTYTFSHWMMVSLAVQKLLSFMRSHVLIVDLGALLMVFCSERLPMHSQPFPTCSLVMFSVSGFMLRFLIHF